MISRSKMRITRNRIEVWSNQASNVQVPRTQGDVKVKIEKGNDNRRKKEDSPIVKGAEFENFIQKRFPAQDFSIVEKTHKFTKPGERYIESDLNPDFVFRHRISGAMFAVEAKYRSSLNGEGKLQWCTGEQLKRYNVFSQERNMPVYIAIGLGGRPNFPDELFLIPLEDAKYVALYPSVFKKYSKNLNDNFYWSNGNLK